MNGRVNWWQNWGWMTTLPKRRPLPALSWLSACSKGGALSVTWGVGHDDDLVMAKATVAVAQRGLSTLTTNAAQVVLLDKDLSQLERFFELAAAFMVKQGFNLLMPIGFDLVDIATTLLIHFGIVYSVLLNFAGLLLSASQAHPTTLRPQPVADASDLSLPALAPIRE
jgi:hypothetical protein